ncbi:MAG: putative colanic acid biosynthesis acetyltransferase [Planctomycetota bacterium]
MKPTPANAARHQSPYSFRAKAGRMLWSVVEVTLFRMTWPTWYRYRAFLLRCFGADVSPASRIRRTCRFMCPWNLSVGAGTATGENVYFYCLGEVRVGARVTLSHDAVLCAGSHDYRTIEMPLLRPPVAVQDDAWVAFGGFVGPGVTVGAGAILAARGVAVRDLEPWGIYGGNPAKRIADRPPLSTGSETTGVPEPPDPPTAPA